MSAFFPFADQPPPFGQPPGWQAVTRRSAHVLSNKCHGFYWGRLVSDSSVTIPGLLSPMRTGPSRSSDSSQREYSTQLNGSNCRCDECDKLKSDSATPWQGQWYEIADVQSCKAESESHLFRASVGSTVRTRPADYGALPAFAICRGISMTRQFRPGFEQSATSRHR